MFVLLSFSVPAVLSIIDWMVCCLGTLSLLLDCRNFSDSVALGMLCCPAFFLLFFLSSSTSLIFLFLSILLFFSVTSTFVSQFVFP